MHHIHAPYPTLPVVLFRLPWGSCTLGDENVDSTRRHEWGRWFRKSIDLLLYPLDRPLDD